MMDDILGDINKSVEAAIMVDSQPPEDQENIDNLQGDAAPPEGDEQNQESAPPSEEPAMSEAEAEAREKGWRPKEEWSGDGEWVDSEEFIRRGSLFKTIGKLKDQISDYKKSTDALVEHNKGLAEASKKAEERGRQKLMVELKERREEAVLDGDLEEFNKVEGELKEIQEEEKPEEPENKPPSADEVEIKESVKAWADTNKWFNKDEAMTSYMMSRQSAYLQDGMTVEQALEKSTSDVKTEFAHKFDNPNKGKPTGMGGRGDAGGKPSYGLNDLPAEFRPIYQAIARKTGMKVTEYMEQLKQTGAL